MGKLFGTDGIRGIAGDSLTPITAYKIGRAAAYVLSKEEHKPPKILIGMDTRLSGPMLFSALAAGVCSVGGNVIDLGIIPTPAVAYLVRKYNADAGVVISASHNPLEYNGIKIFNSKGYKLKDELENQIEALALNDIDELPMATGSDIGTIRKNKNALGDYTDFLWSIFPNLDLTGVKIAMDTAEGSTYAAAPMVFKRLGAQVEVIHNNPNGININLNCGSTFMGEICQLVKTTNVDIGIAFDGDGDRCLITDESGNIIDGDGIMSICSCYMKENAQLKHNTLVVTVMSNLGLFIMGEEKDIKIEKTAVGDRYVLERMLEIDASLGGEQSGHIIFLDHNASGDGILTALNILNIMVSENKSISKLNKNMKVLPQVLKGAKVENHRKYDFEDIAEIKQAIEKLERKFKDKGRVLIRASGTEPLVRVMIEAEDLALIEEEAEKMRVLIEKHLGMSKQ